MKTTFEAKILSVGQYTETTMRYSVGVIEEPKDNLIPAVPGPPRGQSLYMTFEAEAGAFAYGQTVTVTVE